MRQDLFQEGSAEGDQDLRFGHHQHATSDGWLISSEDHDQVDSDNVDSEAADIEAADDDWENGEGRESAWLDDFLPDDEEALPEPGDFWIERDSDLDA
ncbi:hypothetical protein [Botrimarina hoheduenensis]|uniref:Uncharacterized protein n=1 Tax=Botrimarina hoheduenensis TaxID=2528000 RepID=A0A5C5VVT1_9BACT|nr:hypothetical protein [Botrimarina hoheduenensis]TWT42470.1 hypothetical protein Pla111_27750 [Botrimarina hoheduenensis]